MLVMSCRSGLHLKITWGVGGGGPDAQPCSVTAESLRRRVGWGRGRCCGISMCLELATGLRALAGYQGTVSCCCYNTCLPFLPCRHVAELGECAGFSNTSSCTLFGQGGL